MNPQSPFTDVPKKVEECRALVNKKPTYANIDELIKLVKTTTIYEYLEAQKGYAEAFLEEEVK